MAAVAGRIADSGANIDRIERMARYPVTAIDLHVSGADPDRLRTLLAAEAATQGIDVAVQPANLLRRGMRLIVLDVDSTLVQGEVIEMLAEHAGCASEVAAGHRAGDARRARLRGVAARAGRAARGARRRPRSTRCTTTWCSPRAPGRMVRMLRRLGYRFALVSGGFTQITDRLADDLGIHYSPRQRARGRRRPAHRPDRRRRRRPGRQGHGAAPSSPRRSAFPSPPSIAIGDGANDLDMLDAAGLGIAYNAKQVVRDAADTSVNVPYLDAIMYLLGISREEIEAADAEAGVSTPAPPL